ncbi:MAG: hypothetical protein C7B44_13305 [Sulfobacillus thermosulfidooxidans]|uniref:Uncharacterized protein n=1 Tax=Sulfobacillus thermotolerans TaxID=338644 RepID=A0ABM6RQX0_9FIRM|nr:hypothetical protein BXT84_07510 [Sulfobacillus thermotolerans]PSR35615.1 MAG: hypothetical protein C7B44_13305 [Sulfobacillus thermosulfidooxidans]
MFRVLCPWEILDESLVHDVVVWLLKTVIPFLPTNMLRNRTRPYGDQWVTVFFKWLLTFW